MHIVEQYAQAWQRGDLAAIAACYHDEFTLHYGGNNPLSGDHVGKAAALNALRAVSAKTNRKLLEVISVMIGETRSSVLAREQFSRDGRTADVVRLLLYATKDGLLHECWIFERDQALVDEFLR